MAPDPGGSGVAVLTVKGDCRIRNITDSASSAPARSLPLEVEMSRRITIIDGHPDPERARFIHALADAYAVAAEEAGHVVRRINVGEIDFPILRTQSHWQNEPAPPAIAQAAAAIEWAEHLVLLYPLWLGDVPALFKGFLEQVARPNIAFRYREKGMPEKLWAGRSARVIVTMGMPGLFYRLFYRAHSLKSLERNILKFVGIKPVASTVIGMVEGSVEIRTEWLEKIRELGRAGS
jgi:putative NADPH-quinone reductase